jgi:uncharacterized protein (TIGR04255 family)
MTFPESERVVYAVHTLTQVVCQLNFPPILSISAEPPAALQDLLRPNYPLYETVEPVGAPPEIAALMARLPLQIGQSVQHRFSTADGKRSITVGPRMLAISETDYDAWPAFRTEIEAARAALESIYRPAFYIRVGLRYQDVIDRNAFQLKLAWPDLINPSMIGMLGVEFDAIREAVTEAASNVLIRLDGAQNAFVRINHGLAQQEGDSNLVYLIDADYFTDDRKEGSEVLELLGYFNAEAGKLFRWAITDTLRDALGRRDDVAARDE